MKDSITKETTSVYNKINKEATERLKEYKDNINALEKKSRRFWAIENIKEAMFWCMCYAILILIIRATFDMYGFSVPVIVWQIAYPCTFIPLVGYIIRTIVNPPEKPNHTFFSNYK